MGRELRWLYNIAYNLLGDPSCKLSEALATVTVQFMKWFVAFCVGWKPDKLFSSRTQEKIKLDWSLYFSPVSKIKLINKLFWYFVREKFGISRNKYWEMALSDDRKLDNKLNNLSKIGKKLSGVRVQQKDDPILSTLQTSMTMVEFQWCLAAGFEIKYRVYYQMDREVSYTI